MQWLLLRGLAREKRHWGSFPTSLEVTFPGDVAHMVDLPGSGDMRHVPMPLSIPQCVEHVRGQWKALASGKDEPWSLLTISLGGMVGLSWTDRYPDDFESHVVINTSARDAGSLWQRFNLRTVPGFAKGLLGDPEVSERSVLEVTTNLQPDLDARVARFAEFAREAPLPTRTAFRQMYAASRFKAPKSLETSTLFLASKGDRLVDPRCSQTLAERYGAPIHFHPTAGHDLPLDDPHWVLEKMVNWLGTGEARPQQAV